MKGSTFLHPAVTVRAAQIQDGMTVADFSTGSGFFTLAAAREIGPEGEVWAVDVYQDMLPRIKNLALAEGLNNVQVVHGDIERVGGTHLPSRYFDFVIATNILFALQHTQACVEEIHRVLKRSGRALVVDWSNSFGGLGPHQKHVVTRQDAKELFESNGFVYVGDVPAGEYHWGFVVRKVPPKSAQ